MCAGSRKPGKVLASRSTARAEDRKTRRGGLAPIRVGGEQGVEQARDLGREGAFDDHGGV
jgi:hypothetical protein